MKNKSGFSLIEVTLALGLSAFCLTTLIGLIPVGLRSNQSSQEKCSAADVAAILLSDLQSAPKGKLLMTGSNQQVDGLTIPEADTVVTTGTQQIYYSEAVDSHNSHFSTSSAGTRYLVSVSIQPPKMTNLAQRGATNVHVRVTWPALADAKSAQGALEMFSALDRN